MRCDSDSEDSFSCSEESHFAFFGGGQTSLEQLISLNVTIFNDLGFAVSAESFSHAPHPLQEECNNCEEESQRSEIDYGDSEQDAEEDVLGEYYGDEENAFQQESAYSQDWHRWPPHHEDPSVEQSNQSPFFPEAARPEGLSPEEIARIPRMQWSATHNLFNRGEKCAVCLQDFQLGNALRVMECLHRYHLDCLDQWLTVRGTCPSCRTAPQRQKI